MNRRIRSQVRLSKPGWLIFPLVLLAALAASTRQVTPAEASATRTQAAALAAPAAGPPTLSRERPALKVPAPVTDQVTGVSSCIDYFQKIAGSSNILMTSETTRTLCAQLVGVVKPFASGTLATAADCLGNKLNVDPATNLNSLITCVTAACRLSMKPSSDKANLDPHMPTLWTDPDLDTLCANMIRTAAGSPDNFGDLFSCVGGEIAQGIGEPDDSGGPAAIVLKSCASRNNCGPQNSVPSRFQALSDLIAGGAAPTRVSDELNGLLMVPPITEGGACMAPASASAGPSADSNYYIFDLGHSAFYQGYIYVDTKAGVAAACGLPDLGYCADHPHVTVAAIVGKTDGYPTRDDAIAAYCAVAPKKVDTDYYGTANGTINGKTYNLDWVQGHLSCPVAGGPSPSPSSFGTPSNPPPAPSPTPTAASTSGGSGGGGAGGSTGSGAGGATSGASSSGGSTGGASGSGSGSASAGGGTTLAGVTVTDVPSCTRALAGSGFSQSDAASTCQLVAAAVPSGTSFGSFLGCVVKGFNAGNDPVSALLACIAQPPSSGSGVSSASGGGSSSGGPASRSGGSSSGGSTGSSNSPFSTAGGSSAGAAAGSSGASSNASSFAGLSINTPKSSYHYGDSVSLCYTVPGPGNVTITDVQANGNSQVLASGNDNGTGDCLPHSPQKYTAGAPAGQECFRIDFNGGVGPMSLKACFQVGP